MVQRPGLPQPHWRLLLRFQSLPVFSQHLWARPRKWKAEGSSRPPSSVPLRSQASGLRSLPQTGLAVARAARGVRRALLVRPSCRRAHQWRKGRGEVKQRGGPGPSAAVCSGPTSHLDKCNRDIRMKTAPTWATAPLQHGAYPPRPSAPPITSTSLWGQTTKRCRRAALPSKRSLTEKPWTGPAAGWASPAATGAFCREGGGAEGSGLREGDAKAKAGLQTVEGRRELLAIRMCRGLIPSLHAMRGGGAFALGSRGPGA